MHLLYATFSSRYRPSRSVLMGAATRTPDPELPLLRTDPLLLPLLRTDRSLSFIQSDSSAITLPSH